ncbi:isochorismatase family cysteine hydrolase [Acidisoma sp.]|uniref:isochorismatase family cysteine hydrolase n=1 Tax=Acidisoma sp. TaxID=1872115 RepID=UPI003B001555
MRTYGLSRDVPVVLGKTALLFIDVQNYVMPGGGEYAGLDEAEVAARYGYFFTEMETRGLPNMQRLQAACRAKGIEVLYTVIESLTQNGRDLSLDYKISGLFCPRGSRDAQVVDALAPGPDEIVIGKTSSSVFISTNLHYVLGNLGVRHLILAGGLTDQCVDSAVRDACDLGYLVTVPVDACVTQSQQRHDTALANNKGYCRQVTTSSLVSEIDGL